MTFFSQTIAERTKAGQRQDVEDNTGGSGYIGHAYARSDGLVGIIISDKDYPLRVAYSLLTKVLDEFSLRYPPSKFQSATSLDFPELHTYLTRFQDPNQADTIMKVQAELDETKGVLHKTIESVLERGEKLDSLVERSDALSAQSKLFYRSAKKQNSCCTVM